ncbi:methyltransferase family protein [Algoriphagus ratkowskyi]|uniref:Class I SAM-dependent methyltransferase n=1 Tax=Algoriphagus ratkowskyi TaxID=57028 RepID=A0A2W7R6P5_9BACT|nr:class I SAM-dependent methyltransferase [Algoriphagus ratkowskyi]PZX49799.1 methyltransferase family protein [Algoriphagus ratkowskyi]TXD75481.1 class I SAM-dependent methyltransferase [Algoriphagus ratkowskyi]
MESYLGKVIGSWDSEKINDFWDFASKEPKKYFTHNHGNEIVQFFEPDLSNNSKILDYGAGLGFLSEILLKKGYQVKCMDSSSDSLNVLDDKLRGYPNYLGAQNLKDLQNTDVKFDVIFVIEVIEHLNDVFLEELMKNVSALLSNRGQVIFTTPNNEDLTQSYIYCPFSDLIFHRWQHVRSWNKKSLSKTLISMGFNSIETRETHFLPKPKWKGFNRKTIGLFLEYLKHKVEKKKPHLVAIASIT